MVTKKTMDGNFVSIKKFFFGVSKVLYNSKRTFLDIYKLSIFIYTESLELKFIEFLAFFCSMATFLFPHVSLIVMQLYLFHSNNNLHVYT